MILTKVSLVHTWTPKPGVSSDSNPNSKNPIMKNAIFSYCFNHILTEVDTRFDLTFLIAMCFWSLGSNGIECGQIMVMCTISVNHVCLMQLGMMGNRQDRYLPSLRNCTGTSILAGLHCCIICILLHFNESQHQQTTGLVQGRTLVGWHCGTFYLEKGF